MVSTRQILKTLAGHRVPHPLLPSQMMGREVVVEEGQETGMVFCPMKRSEIAEMRCVEYQGMAKGEWRRANGEGQSPTLNLEPGTLNSSLCPCGHAVTPARAKELKEGMRQGGEQSRRERAECDRSRSCGSKGPRRRR